MDGNADGRHYHPERALRPVPAGQRNWLFAWTEISAERVGPIQGLLATSTLQGVDPNAYLVGVLQRGEYPASRVVELTRGCGKRCSLTTRCVPISARAGSARLLADRRTERTAAGCDAAVDRGHPSTKA